MGLSDLELGQVDKRYVWPFTKIGRDRLRVGEGIRFRLQMQNVRCLLYAQLY